jgi:cell division protein FtsI/penicillin-binding protein 2
MLGTLGLLTLVAFESPGAQFKPKPSDSVPPRTKFSALDITQARAEGSGLVVKDSQGHQWQLTVDVSLQQNAQRRLASAHPKAGAIVAIETKTGKVRVLTEWPSAASRGDSILLGRQFPAASVFKIVTTAALVEHAHVDLQKRVCTEGGAHRLELEQLFSPRSGIAECGPFAEALGFSRNAAIAQLASQYLSPEDLENYADRFGFGTRLPLEISVPLGQFQSEGEPLGFARAATGFTGSTLSPLGAAYLAYVVASGGRALPLQLVDDDSTALADKAGEFLAIRPETASALRHMMETTVRRGTSWRAFHDKHGHPFLNHVSVAGKTGTLGVKDATISWFVGFAPSQKPEIAISVLLENSPVWHKKANEVARDWLIDYFSRKHSRRISKKLPANEMTWGAS